MAYNVLMNHFMKSLILCTFVSIGSAVAYADDFHVTLVPIVGFEHVQKIAPQVGSTTRFVYGARATAGYFFLAGELEYTHGDDTARDSTTGISDRNVDEKIKIGARSSYALASMLTLTGRAGVQASQNRHVVTPSGGAASSVTSPIAWDPYAGAELSAHLAESISIQGGIVVVFTDLKDLSKNDYQTTLGFTLKY